MILQAACGLYIWSVEIQMIQSNTHLVIFQIMALGLAGTTLPAYAQDAASKNMDVSADITETCNMSNTDLNFGDYDAFGANATQDLLATATITTTCTSGATSVVTMSGGSHYLFCETSKCHRQMANIDKSSFLRYNIYTKETASWGFVWSDNPTRPKEVAQVMGAGFPQNLTVYGRIPKNQKTVVAGSYTDKVNITLSY
jgi:spore coat protein U-like protein